MSVAGLDANSRQTLTALSNANDGTIVDLWADPTTHRLLIDNANSGGGITVGTTTITSGTTTRILYDNAGVVGEYTLTGSGTVVAMATSPTFQTSVNGAYLTASQILITDGSKNIISATVATYPSLTELSYVKGVTSSIQTQINSITGGLVFTNVTGTSQAAAVNSGYIANNAGLVTITLPATAVIGSVVAIVGNGAGSWALAQNAGQAIHLGNQFTTTGVTGSLTTSNQYDCVEVVCTATNTTWVVRSSIGNIYVN